MKGLCHRVKRFLRDLGEFLRFLGHLENHRFSGDRYQRFYPVKVQRPSVLFMKIYQLNESESYVAESLEAAIAYAVESTGVARDEITDEHCHELTDEELDSHIFCDWEPGEESLARHYRCDCGAEVDLDCRWSEQKNTWEHNHGNAEGFVPMKNVCRRTFREQLAKLIAEGLSSPEVFAASEF